MSLARSASGPAGLTINTGAANSLTTPSQPAASGGLFGSGAANTTTTGGMFGNTQQKPATGLFGQPAAGTTSTPAAGGLFGNTNTQAQNTTGGGLFGNTTTNTTAQSATGGGLFGNTAANTTTQPTTGGGLFGNTAAKPATGGLFGNTATQQTQQPSTGTSLFGQSTTQTQPTQQTGGLFGASTTTNTQPATGGGLFGQSQAKPAGSLFGQTQTQQPNTGAALGQSTTNPVSAVQINWDSIRPRTRFDDLAKPVQDEIALLDKGIQRVIKMKDEIGEFMPQHERDIEQLGRDVKFVESKFKVVQVALNNDIQTVKVLQDMTKKNIADAQLSFKATDNLKLPTHYHQTGLFASTSPSNDGNSADAASTHANAQDLITYFNRICDDIEKYKKRLDDYRSDIERDMPGVENGLYEQIRALRERGSGNVVVQDKLGEVLAALRDTGNAIIAQAGQIAETRERLSRLQAGILDSGAYALGMAA